MVRSCERKIFIPNCQQMKNPALIPANFKLELSKIDLWNVKPFNQVYIAWRSQPVSQEGGSGGVNLVEFHTAFRRWIYAN